VVAQPVTFESMRIAQRKAEGQVMVDLLAVGYVEDQPIMPKGFQILAPLSRSVMDVGSFQKQRKLPLLRDILDRLYENSDADFLIYTNVDIGLQPQFYLAVDAYIKEGFDVFVINRRTISKRYERIEQLPEMWAEEGEAHRGWDCFIFPRSIFPRFELGDVCVGMPRVGLALLANMVAYGRRFAEFRNSRLTFHIGDDRRGKVPKLADYHEHNTRELMWVLSSLERQNGPFGRRSIPGSFIWRKRKFGPLYEFWSRNVYLPSKLSRFINRLLVE
jgi:hypothetical protein